MCVCVFARSFLIYWPTDLLMCVRLHAAQSTSLEHPGLASLGAHALKLLTFPNLFPSLLIVVKNWTQPPTLRSCMADLHLMAFVLCLSIIYFVECGMLKLACICPGNTC